MSVFDRFKGQRILLHGKYNYSGIVVETEGKWLILDDAWQHFWCDAEIRVRDSSDPPIYLGDGLPVNTDFVESGPPTLAWLAEEEAASETKRGRKAKKTVKA